MLTIARRGAMATMGAAVVVAGAASVTGCSWLHFGTQDDTYDYRKATPRQEPLEVPPDLSQLPKDDRFAVPINNANATKPANANTAAASTAASPTTVASVAPGAAAAATAATPVVAAAPGAMAPTVAGVAPAIAGVRIEHDCNQRWLAVDVSPELAYATVKDLWVGMGLKIATDEPLLGILETQWSEKHPEVEDEGAFRNGLHRVFGAYDANGERYKYRARIERTAKNTSEITITERGLEEVFEGPMRETTKWQYHPESPELEAEMLQRVALRFVPVQPAQAAVAPSSTAPVGAPVAAAAPADSRVHKVTAGGLVTLQVEDTLDHTWRKVGLALDRGGFTIEDRSRDKNLYTVRYLDPDYETSEREKKSWWDRVFNADAKIPEQQFHIVISANGPVTVVEVQDKDGRPDNGATATRILDQLMEQLR
jgi:outer membrane protein assembly factor BamC